MKVLTTPQPRKSRKASQQRDANSVIPEHLTEVLIQAVKALPAHSVKIEYLQDVFLSKFVGPNTASATERKFAAIAKWLVTEERNLETNYRLMWLEDDFNIINRVTWRRFLETVRKIVLNLIGEYPCPAALNCGFSGGASTSRKRTESQPASKYLGRVHITGPAIPWFDMVLSAMPGYEQYANGTFYEGHLIPVRVPSNVLFTVPKNTEIDRVAAKEPDLNMFLQRGIGNHIRRALMKVGINLNDQTINQRLARQGSFDGSLATIDLSSASDSVTITLCEKILPPAWFSFLMDVRSPETLVEGIEHSNEMMSSMGNGFTFELQSMIYYALARATARHMKTPGVISVYGDDIILPSELYDDFGYVLKVCGFSLNGDKSFAKGPFRESCGGHYHNGVDITPFYLRAPLKKVVDLVHICNQIRRWADSGCRILDPVIEALWFELAGHIPRSLWGGSDVNADHQLVADCAPRSRLIPIKGKQHDFSSENGYMHWLNATDGRSGCSVGFDTPIQTTIQLRRKCHGSLLESVETSETQDTTESFRSRLVPKYADRFRGAVFPREAAARTEN